MSDNKNTVKYYIEQLSKFPMDALVSVEDMDGNAIYPQGEFASHIDADEPSVELILPVYLKKIAIEPNFEKDVFTNSVEIIE